MWEESGMQYLTEHTDRALLQLLIQRQRAAEVLRNLLSAETIGTVSFPTGLCSTVVVDLDGLWTT